jgi:hypothetical protein
MSGILVLLHFKVEVTLLFLFLQQDANAKPTPG